MTDHPAGTPARQPSARTPTGQRISVIGPTHPTKGGIAQHTDALVDELVRAGHRCTVETWAAQYPNRLYPGRQTVPAGPSPPRHHDEHHRSLRWYDPTSWIRAGLRCRHSSIVVVAMVVPIQVVALATILLVARIRRPRTRIVVIAHNVLPHEPLPFDRLLVRVLLRRADHTITHTEPQRMLAEELGARSVASTPLPPHLVPEGRRNRSGEAEHRRLLFFGIVRPYKGLDDLLRAVVSHPDVQLSVQGEIWNDETSLRQLIDELDLGSRVTVRGEYVPDDQLPQVFSDVDALVLPYRSGTASQLVLIAHHLGLPVIATTVGSFPDQIEDGIDGLLCNPGSPADLAAAIRALYEPGRLDQLRDGAFRAQAADHLWDPYLAEVTGS